ncbi:MAG: hypothetical protein AAGI72_05455 [Pseudomonadota bacterium]
MPTTRLIARSLVLVGMVATPAPGSASCAHNILGDWQLDASRASLNVSEAKRARILTLNGGRSTIRLSFDARTMSYSRRSGDAWSEPDSDVYTVAAENGPHCELLFQSEDNHTETASMHVYFDEVGFCVTHGIPRRPTDCYIKR